MQNQESGWLAIGKTEESGNYKPRFRPALKEPWNKILFLWLSPFSLNIAWTVLANPPICETNELNLKGQKFKCLQGPDNQQWSRSILTKCQGDQRLQAPSEEILWPVASTSSQLRHWGSYNKLQSNQLKRGSWAVPTNWCPQWPPIATGETVQGWTAQRREWLGLWKMKPEQLSRMRETLFPR